MDSTDTRIKRNLMEICNLIYDIIHGKLYLLLSDFIVIKVITYDVILFISNYIAINYYCKYRIFLVI